MHRESTRTPWIGGISQPTYYTLLALSTMQSVGRREEGGGRGEEGGGNRSCALLQRCISGKGAWPSREHFYWKDRKMMLDLWGCVCLL